MMQSMNTSPARNTAKASGIDNAVPTPPAPIPANQKPTGSQPMERDGCKTEGFDCAIKPGKI